ncbi:MAG: sodium/proton-translocating pyrophosphatase, partial [Elusimicrobia bacterium]|nr:sodium/proton-translocating pyrophosphatase [Elusimicrobiota bacterium]
MKPALILVFGISAIALVVAGWLIQWVMGKDTGTKEMQRISDAIKSGAEAFLRRQNKTIIGLAALFAVVIFVLYAFVRQHNEHDPAAPMVLAIWTTLSFVMGAACSVIAGYIGMWVSIRSNIRTAAAARHSLNDALQIALRGGAVSGLFVTAMSLLGVGGLFALLKVLGYDFA